MDAYEVSVPAAILCCFVRIRGTCELTAAHKSRGFGRLHSPDRRLSEPEVFADQPKAAKQFWVVVGVVSLCAISRKLVAK